MHDFRVLTSGREAGARSARGASAEALRPKDSAEENGREELLPLPGLAQGAATE